jgi:hypothetical protein
MNKGTKVFWQPLWSSGQSSWLRLERSGFDSRSYQIFWEVVGLERGPLSLVSTIEELLGRKSSGSCLKNRDYSSRDPSRWPRGTLYPQKLALTSPTNSSRSVGIVCSWTQGTEFSFSVGRIQSNYNRKLTMGLYCRNGWLGSGKHRFVSSLLDFCYGKSQV